MTKFLAETFRHIFMMKGQANLGFVAYEGADKLEKEAPLAGCCNEFWGSHLA